MKEQYNIDNNKRAIENPSISKSVEESRTINRKHMTPERKTAYEFLYVDDTQ